MKFDGYGVEYAAKYYGGPADGLEAPVIVLDAQSPPDIACLELYNLVESKSEIGQHFLRHRAPHKTRVGVYMLENDPNDDTWSDGSEKETLIYQFVEMMYYKEYVEKYGEK